MKIITGENNILKAGKTYKILAIYCVEDDQTTVEEDIEKYGIYCVETELKESPGILTDDDIDEIADMINIFRTDRACTSKEEKECDILIEKLGALKQPLKEKYPAKDTCDKCNVYTTSETGQWYYDDCSWYCNTCTAEMIKAEEAEKTLEGTYKAIPCIRCVKSCYIREEECLIKQELEDKESNQMFFKAVMDVFTCSECEKRNNSHHIEDLNIPVKKCTSILGCRCVLASIAIGGRFEEPVPQALDESLLISKSLIGKKCNHCDDVILLDNHEHIICSGCNKAICDSCSFKRTIEKAVKKGNQEHREKQPLPHSNKDGGIVERDRPSPESNGITSIPKPIECGHCNEGTGFSDKGASKCYVCEKEVCSVCTKNKIVCPLKQKTCKNNEITSPEENTWECGICGNIEKLTEDQKRFSCMNCKKQMCINCEGKKLFLGYYCKNCSKK